MIFAHTWQKVLDGSKTLTTRRVYFLDGAPVPCRYVPGRSYAVQKQRGGKAVARVEIVSVVLLPNLNGISLEYAKAEGFETVEAFQETFRRVNGTGLDEPVYSIRFRKL